MATRSKTKKTALYLVLTLVLFSIDQGTKAWALASLPPFQGKPFIGDVLKFYLVWNDSAAFSITLGATWIFTIISSVATLVVIWLMLRTSSKAWRFTLAILLAGVVGNLADRLFREPGFAVGKVVDFLQLPFNFPVFNVADICITSSMTAVVILVMRGIKLGS
jgi:signal peptidase II